MNTTIELTGIAAELLKAADLDTTDNPKDILCPSWSDLCKVYDWRNYIPEEMRERWLSRSLDARIAAYIMAEKIVSYEDWDD